jgi:hypothetical protein
MTEIVKKTKLPAPPTRFASHTTVLPEKSGDEARWTPISRKECIAARAFFSLQEAYRAR